MKNIQLLNKIAKKGTEIFDKNEYNVSEDIKNPDAILVRSAAMHEMQFNGELKAIARAGAGVNNIPLDRCAEEGIVVFNTPGANANAVKELAVAALLLASRDIYGGITWANGLAGQENVAKTVEKGKSAFGGYELIGKTLGIIGLGAIGGKLANIAVALGMNVVGCDPYLSDYAKSMLDEKVELLPDFESVFKVCDYLSVHVPATEQTKGFLNAKAFSLMKDGVRIINLARADLINATELKAAIESGKIAAYVTDFPTEETVGVKGIVAMPHLGASTEEAEDNCAEMAVRQTIEYLENGNIKNSVNYPNTTLERSGKNRICVLHENKDGLGESIISSVSGKTGSVSNARGKYAYTVVDTNDETESASEKIGKLDGIFRIITL